MILILVIAGWSPLSHTDYQLINDSTPSFSKRYESSVLDVVIIESNEDFKTYNWTGNGTITNPYVLSNETIEGERCIQISDTSSHFRIENCTLISEYYGVVLSNVENGVIIECTVNSGSSGIRFFQVANTTIQQNSILSDRGSGIELDQSTQCDLSNNIIRTNREMALWLYYCDQCTIRNNTMSAGSGVTFAHSWSTNSIIIDNTLLGGTYGFASYENHNCSILNNTIASNKNAILLAESTNQSIIGNRFGSIYGETAIDDGFNNSWDDGISLGNAWLDYQGFGDYNITGEANSTDHFPTKFEPSFPLDWDGPYLSAYVGFALIEYFYELPSNYTFRATVNDTSGVDTVLITVNGIVHEMVHQPSVYNPDAYVYVHPISSKTLCSMTFSYWANDTLSFNTETGNGYYSLAVWNICPPTSTINTTCTADLTTEYFFMVGSVSLLVISLVVLLISKKRKSLQKI